MRVTSALRKVANTTTKFRYRHHVLTRMHSVAGCIVVADRVRKAPPRNKFVASERCAWKQLRGIGFKTTHTIVEMTGVVISVPLLAIIEGHLAMSSDQPMNECMG